MCNSKDLGNFSGRSGLKSHPDQWLSWLTVFGVVLNLSRQIPVQYLHRLLPHPYLLSIDDLFSFQPITSVLQTSSLNNSCRISDVHGCVSFDSFLLVVAPYTFLVVYQSFEWTSRIYFHFIPEGLGSIFLWNVYIRSEDYTVQHPRRPQSEHKNQWTTDKVEI